MEILDNVWKAGRSCIGIVLVQTEYDGQCAYMEVVPGFDEKTDIQHVASWGTKLTFNEAKGFFPYIETKDYRIEI
jgi:hypothetical protein